VLCTVLFLPAVAGSQTSADSSDDRFADLPIPSWGTAIIESFNKPLHPVIGGVASGGGLGFGIGYDSPAETGWYTDAEAMITVRRYWSVEGEVGRRSTSQRSQIGVFGGVRHMNRIDYFGLGPATNFDTHSVFRLRETTFGARGWYRPMAAVRVGGSAGIYVPDLGRGAHPRVPSIEEVFAPDDVPGFSAQPTLSRYRTFVELTHKSKGSIETADDDVDAYGAAYQVALEVARDHDTGRHNFHRWEGEVQQRIPGLRTGQRLTLHGFMAVTNEDADVPFYLLYTLGGSGGLKAFRPDLIGTDGTRATLRGFRSYRFRDRDLLLMQAEYRIPLREWLHATVFVDAGQVAPRTRELFDDLHTSTGFSLSYMRKGRSLGRVDIGFGGGEGVHVLWSFDTFE
jgi:hypothetical protein